MGRREVHVVRVPKGVTVVLLLLVSAAMVTFYVVFGGRTYVRPQGSTEDLLLKVMHREEAGTLTFNTAVAFLWPVAANILLYVPWGFLAYIALDTPRRSRLRTFVATLAGGVVLAAAVEIWQMSLPSPIATVSDSIANIVGVAAGALAGQLRKQVRFRFEV